MGKPDAEPIGLLLTRTAKAVSRAFDQALTEAGGSLPTWLVLVSLKGGAHGAQRELADAVGIEGPTLTHHLNRMETAGLVTRRRDPENRRAHRVELTRTARPRSAGSCRPLPCSTPDCAPGSPTGSSPCSAGSSTDFGPMSPLPSARAR